MFFFSDEDKEFDVFMYLRQNSHRCKDSEHTEIKLNYLSTFNFEHINQFSS